MSGVCVCVCVCADQPDRFRKDNERQFVYTMMALLNMTFTHGVNEWIHVDGIIVLIVVGSALSGKWLWVCFVLLLSPRLDDLHCFISSSLSLQTKVSVTIARIFRHLQFWSHAILFSLLVNNAREQARGNVYRKWVLHHALNVILLHETCSLLITKMQWFIVSSTYINYGIDVMAPIGDSHPHCTCIQIRKVTLYIR